MNVSMVRQKESKGFISEQRWQIASAVVNITIGPQGIVLIWLGVEVGLTMDTITNVIHYRAAHITELRS